MLIAISIYVGIAFIFVLSIKDYIKTQSNNAFGIEEEPNKHELLFDYIVVGLFWPFIVTALIIDKLSLKI